jgi:hypothetical protein
MLCIAFSIPECNGKNFFSLALFERLFALAFKARAISSPEVSRSDAVGAGRERDCRKHDHGVRQAGVCFCQPTSSLQGAETMAGLRLHGKWALLFAWCPSFSNRIFFTRLFFSAWSGAANQRETLSYRLTRRFNVVARTRLSQGVRAVRRVQVKRHGCACRQARRFSHRPLGEQLAGKDDMPEN